MTWSPESHFGKWYHPARTVSLSPHPSTSLTLLLLPLFLSCPCSGCENLQRLCSRGNYGTLCLFSFSIFWPQCVLFCYTLVPTFPSYIPTREVLGHPIWGRTTKIVVLVRVPIVLIKHHDQKQLGKERVCFSLNDFSLFQLCDDSHLRT
jgi:hypothetical protein